MATISRRRFVTIAGGATAAIAAAVVLNKRVPEVKAAPANPAGPMGLPVGIQLYMVSTPMKDDTPGTLAKLHEVGYREVETAGTDKYSPKEFRALIEGAGLKCPSVHLQVKGEDFEAAFADANALGAHYAVTSVLNWPRPAAHEPGTPVVQPKFGLDGFKKMAEKMNEVGKRAKAAGIQYAYHNHNLEFEKLPDGSIGFDLLVKETDPELVKFEIDCGWMEVAGGNPVDYFKNYPGRFKMLHIKDFKAGSAPTTEIMGAGRPKGADLGTGFVDYGPIFAAGKAAGIEHIFAEQEAPFAVSQMASAIADFGYIEKFA